MWFLFDMRGRWDGGDGDGLSDGLDVMTGDQDMRSDEQDMSIC